MSTPRPGLRDAFWLCTAPFKNGKSLTADFKVAAFTGQTWRMLKIAAMLEITDQHEWGEAFSRAARGGHLDTVKAILMRDDFASGSVVKSWLSVGMIEAAKAGKMNVVDYLFAQGADPAYMDCAAVADVLANEQAALAAKMLGAITLPVTPAIADKMLESAVHSGDEACVSLVVDRIKNISPAALRYGRDYAQAAQDRHLVALLDRHLPPDTKKTAGRQKPPAAGPA